MVENGIIILEPYASAIINRQKIREYRSYDLPSHYKDTPLYLLSGGFIYGIIKFWKTENYNESDGWCWYIELIKEFIPRIKYNHPKGAQKFVKNVNKLQTKINTTVYRERDA